MNYINYKQMLQTETSRLYGIAEQARSKGLDVKTEVEMHRANDLAARVEELVGPKGVSERIRELIKANGRDKASLIIIDEIMDKKFCSFKSEAAGAEQAVRTALTMLTEGILVAGTEGVSKLEVNKNPDGSSYCSIYFASPIRSAGGTAAGLAVMLADYARKKMGVADYRPTDTEVERYVEEITIYKNSVAKLQYTPTDDEIKHIVKNCPVCIDGDKTTSTIEVSVYKNLPRVATNCIRGGMCLVVAEGIAQKSAKLLKFSRKYGIDWDWLEGIIKVVKKSGKEEIKPNPGYLGDVVGGRPIFAYPSRPGGFRLRYGRARNSGINAKCIHPATMRVLDDFAAIGTQLKIERPGKGCAITPCSTIEAPVVRLKNGDVIRLDDSEKVKDIKEDISSILFLGDMLICYGDFLKSTHPLLPSGICEEWWEQIAEQKGVKFSHTITDEEAVKISRENQIPLHPKYTHMFGNLTKDEVLKLKAWLSTGKTELIDGFEGRKVERLTAELRDEKVLLEKICMPHKVRNGSVIIESPLVIKECLGIGKTADEEKIKSAETALALVNIFAGFPVYNKAPSFIGARMGRPEKSKERAMSPPVHGLTPIGNFGGKTRSVMKAAEKGKITIDIAYLYCEKCKKETFAYKCPDCGARAKLIKSCMKCGTKTDDEKCPRCDGNVIAYHKSVIDMKAAVEKPLAKMKISSPDKVKGVLGMMNDEKYFEPVEKTLLRAKYGVYVFKDGTSRFDATNIPLTHFKPREIGLSVEKTRSLGYLKDYKRSDLTDNEQIVEMFPQDMVVSERCAEYMFRVANFVDDLLEYFYGMPRAYNLKKTDDIIGHFVAGMAPHISAGTVARIIGVSKARGCYAHPYFHCACRRDCDGDEDSIMLLLDALLNFSKEYVPDRAGGTEDVPQILSVVLNPSEVDDQVFDMETTYKFPIEFYEMSQKFINPADIKLETVSKKLGTENVARDIGFLFDTYAIDEGPSITSYSSLKTMSEKVNKELELAVKIMAVDERDLAERILNFHFLRDIYGNLRSFGQQTFRCVDCARKYRRVPLVGKCLKCGGKILLTVHKGGIEKYLGVSQEMAEKYGLGDYLKQRLRLVERDLESIFHIEPEKKMQHSLAEFM
ncbi:MAG: DNA polymerase II large subunit [Candidatus Micrarchaeota archaeon]